MFKLKPSEAWLRKAVEMEGDYDITVCPPPPETDLNVCPGCDGPADNGHD